MKFKKRILAGILMATSSVGINADTYNVLVLQEHNKYVIEENNNFPNPDGWLFYFNTYGQLTNINDMEETTLSHSVNINNEGITYSDLPKGSMGIKDIGTIDISNNELISVNFLHGLENINNLFLDDNPINEITGLSTVTKVNDSIRFSLEQTFTDLEPLTNLTKGKLYFYRDLSDFNQYASNFDYSTPFCQGISSNMISTYSVGNVKTNAIDLCTTNDDWMDFFHKHGNYIEYGTQSEIPVNSDYIWK